MPRLSTDTRIAVICNPAAGRGRAARQLPLLERELARAKLDHRVLTTAGAGDATRLALSACEGEARAIVVVGGDGTLNEVSQAYLDADGKPIAAPPIALLCAGTGDDFGRVCNGPHRDPPRSLVERLIHLRTRSVDAGLVTLRDARGEEVRRVFINVASVGVAGHVDQLVARAPRYLGSKAAYALASLRALITYRNVPLELSLDGRSFYRGPAYLAAIANGRFFGCGYQIAPNSSITDGLLDVVCLGDFSRRSALTLGSKLRRGDHLREHQVHSGRAKQVEVVTRDPVLVDVDGETPGYSSLVARIVPNAMRFVIE